MVTEKTKLIQELLQAPVRTGKKRAVRSKVIPVDIQDESIIAARGYGEAEEYRFSAKFSASFVRHPQEHEMAKSRHYHNLLRSVTEGVYGEVRAEIHRLLPRLIEIQDYELMREFEDAFSDILEMTQP